MIFIFIGSLQICPRVGGKGEGNRYSLPIFGIEQEFKAGTCSMASFCRSEGNNDA